MRELLAREPDAVWIQCGFWFARIGNETLALDEETGDLRPVNLVHWQQCSTSCH